MNTKVKQILEDLYKIDPSLGEKEEELVKIINKFLESRPDTKFDKNFAKRLRGELLSKFSSAQSQSTAWENILNFMSAKKLAYAAGGSLIAASVIIAAAVMLSGQKGQSLNLTFKSTTEAKGAHAFGTLAFDSSAAPVAPSVQGTVMGLGGAASANDSSAVAPRAVSVKTESGVGGGGTASFAMPNPYSTSYSFKYGGDTVDISGIDLPVMKRNKTSDAASKVGGILGKYNFGFMNLSKFSNLRADNISLVEEAADGYSIYFNLADGQASINKNQQNYVMAAGGMVKGTAVAPERPIQNLSEADVPADDVLISIANKFLDKYGIDKSVYGAPEVDSSWKNQIMTMKAEGQLIYAPQFISVLYPLQINGVPVYEEYGGRSGMYVAIDVRDNSVQSVNNLYTQNYTSSKYDLETDFSKIVKIAEAGGLTRVYRYGKGKTQEFELMAPKTVYIKKYTYANGISEEMLVPGLMFEVKNTPATGYYYGVTNVMAPLAKDLLDGLEKGETVDGGPIILPMSAPEPAVKGSGSSAGQ